MHNSSAASFYIVPAEYHSEPNAEFRNVPGKMEIQIQFKIPQEGSCRIVPDPVHEVQISGKAEVLIISRSIYRLDRALRQKRNPTANQAFIQCQTSAFVPTEIPGSPVSAW